MKSTKFLILCLLVLYCPFIYGSDDPIQLAALTEDDFLGEIPQVLTVSRLRQSPADTPVASTIIDRKTIEAAGIIDLPEVFRLVPGFYVGTNAGFITNTNHVVSYHGLTDAYARSMQVLIDGRTIYQPLYGGVQWSEIPITIDDIDRIEVTRGPNSASYGANAFLGTINIITKEPTGVAGNQISLNHGNGRNEAFYNHSGKLNNLNYWISAGYREDDGLKNRYDFKRTNLINTRANLKLSEKYDVDLEFGYANGEREEGSSAQDNPIFRPRTRDIYNHFELIKWNAHLNSNDELYVQAFHTFDHSRDTITTAPITAPVVPGVFITPSIQSFDNPYQFERFDLETQFSSNIGNNIQYAVGGSIRRDTLYSPFWIGSNKDQVFDLKRLFAQVQYDIHPKITLNAGVMIENNDFTDTDTSPRASINFHATQNQTFRLGYSEAYRTPSYLEEKFRGGIQLTTNTPTNILLQRFYDEGNLKPEKIQSREIGYLANWEMVSIDAKLFRDTISNYIDGFDNNSFVAPPNTFQVGPDAGTSRNFGSFDTSGFETQIKLALSADTKFLINYAHIKNTPNNVKPNHVNDIIEATPRDISSFLITHSFNTDWNGSFAGYYTSPVQAFGDGNPVDTNYRFDARIAKKFTMPKMSGEISLNVQNLTDRHDKEFADYNELRRRAFMNVKLDF
ncbi:MAG: TonB-dependent receptor plug domain-containing protein [Methylophilus sp.]